jgi:type IV pilus assembly protein PilO
MNLSQLFKKEDFKNLNPKFMYNWPMGPKIVIVIVLSIAVLALGGYFYLGDKQSSLDQAKSQEDTLKQTYIDKRKQAVNLDLYKKQLSDMQKTYSTLLKELPNKSEMDALLTDINQAAISRGLNVELFKPDKEITSDFYAEVPIQLKLDGKYEDIGRFTEDLGLLTRIVILSNINLTTRTDGMIVMSATARTFRYLDDDELAQKKAAEKKAKQKPKKTIEAKD